MSFINLYFATIVGTRTMITLSEDFQLAEMLEVIRKEINETAVERCIFMCKGKRLSLDDATVFQDQKRKFIRNGDVILIGNKITDNYLKQVRHRLNESGSFMTICLITANGQQKVCKIPEKFNFIDLIQLIEDTYGQSALKNSRFMCMSEELILTDKFAFERQRKLIRNGSIIFETLRSKTDVHMEQDLLGTEEVANFQNVFVLCSILFLLIFCFSHV